MAPKAVGPAPSSALRAVHWLASRLFVACIATVALPVGAEEGLAQSVAHAPLSVLDGKTFQAQLGRGDDAPIDDLLIFSNGLFVSKECEARCGYAETKYWVRAEEGAIEMYARSPCLKSDAVIIWEGTIRGDEIEGTYTWINKRWYWSFEKEFEFKGQLVNASTVTDN